MIHKARKQGNLSDLKEQIQKMENKGAFKVLKEDEIQDLGELPHLFTQYNWVFNPNSESTPFHLITNTSAINSGTTISVEQMSPQKILNPMINSSTLRLHSSASFSGFGMLMEDWNEGRSISKLPRPSGTRQQLSDWKWRS